MYLRKLLSRIRRLGMVPGEPDCDKLDITRSRGWRYANITIEELRRDLDLMAFLHLDCIPQNRVGTLIVN